MAHLIYTVGHSTLDIAEFVRLLKLHQVSFVADVRSTPYSKFQPVFNRESLQHGLQKYEIGYVFLGVELGARSTDPSCYVDGRVQYDRLALSPAYSRGIERLITGAQSHTIAVMCSEKEPLDCHRTLLVARTLTDRLMSVSHILPNGEAEEHDATLMRLLGQLGLQENAFFKTRREILDEAIQKQERKIAYVDKAMKEMGEPA